MFHFNRYVVKLPSTREIFFPGPIPKRKQPQRHKYLAQIAIEKSFDCEGNIMPTLIFVVVRSTFLPILQAELIEIKVCPCICACVFSDEFNIHSTLKTLWLKTLTGKNSRYCLFKKVPPTYGV